LQHNVIFPVHGSQISLQHNFTCFSHGFGHGLGHISLHLSVTLPVHGSQTSSQHNWICFSHGFSQHGISQQGSSQISSQHSLHDFSHESSHIALQHKEVFPVQGSQISLQQSFSGFFFLQQPFFFFSQHGFSQHNFLTGGQHGLGHGGSQREIQNSRQGGGHGGGQIGIHGRHGVHGLHWSAQFELNKNFSLW